MTGEQPDGPERSGLVLALAAVPVLCCAAPAVLAALGAGSLGAALGGTTGKVALTVIGVCAAVVALVLLPRRGGRR